MQATQVDLFKEQGYLRLEGFHARKQLVPIQQQLLAELKRLNIWASGKSLSSTWQALPPFPQIARLSTLIKMPGLHETLMTPALLSILSSLAGRTLGKAQDMQLLLSLPRQGTWTLQRLNWHVDVTADPPDQLPGIQAFVLIDDLAPKGGATLAVAGSHHHHARGSASAQVLRDLLARAPADLETRLADKGMHLLEMCGKAGDVVLMDMRLLHTPSINATKHLRMMATSRFLFTP